MSDQQLAPHIVVSREILHGKPRIQGTRIPVYIVLDLLAAGKSVSEITSGDYYPEITEADIRACIAYASEMVRNDLIVPGA